jgi:5-methylcytosine-specific restriction endonuclease McrA
MTASPSSVGLGVATTAAWSRRRTVHQSAYASSEYRRNRELALTREPICHWRLPGCTGRSTTADHVIPLARGGTNELVNLVGACRRCNEQRGGAEGRTTIKRDAERRRQR